MKHNIDDVNWPIEQEESLEQDKTIAQIKLAKENIACSIANGRAPMDNVIKYMLKMEEKHALKNRKKYEKRKQIRKNSNLSTRRWTRWSKKMNSVQYYDYCKQVEKLEDTLQSNLDLLLENGNIIGLFKSYGIDIKEKYLNYKGLCPDHQEQTASFYISKSKGVCKCFGCGHWHQILRYIFVRMFWEWTQYNLKRLNKIKDDLSPYLSLPAINRFDKNWNPTERAYPDRRKTRKKFENISQKHNDTNDTSWSLPF